ncbi:DUF1365 domain-containing protein [Sedimentitalea sp. HM32M-2]|uniref:DUF1365 domain-containing protein n=1 Tax=Sedimentitalea sp. HM32M-2 TaxID=3351566 RepID=UPI0036372D3F
MRQPAQYIPGVTTHRRRGATRHGFRYAVDYVLIDAEQPGPLPLLFSHNRFNLASVQDRHHGGVPGAGRGAGWVRDLLARHGLSGDDLRLHLLTQPAFLGRVFNPVSFWLVRRQSDLVAVIAEVSTPFGDRHSYLCCNPGFAPITAQSRIARPKSLHVSPFQQVAGGYEFVFDIRKDQVAIRILYSNGDEGVLATLTGPCRPLTSAALLGAALRRPPGALRTILLIYWQALRLKLKGVRYRTRPAPPKTEVT